MRAALWRATLDVERATHWSAWLGQAIAWCVVAIGVGLAFVSHGDRVAAAMWVAFAGWFVASAAAKAYAGVVGAKAGLSGASGRRAALES